MQFTRAVNAVVERHAPGEYALPRDGLEWESGSLREIADSTERSLRQPALDTATEQADEIAFKLRRRISPDIYSKYDRAQLEKLASGEAMRDLQMQIEQAREEQEATKEALAEYRCPYCEAPLSSRVDAPLDENERDWDVVEHFECGYSRFAGQVQRPCPGDPRFPGFGDYDLRFSELTTDPLWKWSCFAVGKTPMAELLSLNRGLGRTQEKAAAGVKESYDYYAKRRSRAS